MGSHPKRKNLFLEEQILSFKSRPPFGREVKTRKWQRSFPKSVPIQLNWYVDRLRINVCAFYIRVNMCGYTSKENYSDTDVLVFLLLEGFTVKIQNTGTK